MSCAPTALVEAARFIVALTALTADWIQFVEGA